jgi:hypothetical protein
MIRSKADNVLAPLKIDQNCHARDERIPGLYSKYGNHQKADHSIILVPYLFPSHIMIWENVYRASLLPLAALLPPRQQ